MFEHKTVLLVSLPLVITTMSQNKTNRVTRYAVSDESFTYKPTENYILEDFLNLSILKIQSIASVLKIHNVKRYKKEELIPLVLQKHDERQNCAVNDYEVCEEPLKSEEGDLKYQLYQFQHIRCNGETWYLAKAVANFLEYKHSKKIIRENVDACNKISHENLCPHDCLSKNQTGIHPQTIFINENGLSQLIERSHMPLATGQKRELEEVYVATTDIYNERGVYKIGKAECSTKRIRILNTGRAPDDELYLCYVAQCYDALKAEKLIHSALDSYRISPNREFFKHSLDESKNAVDNVCGKLQVIM